MAALRGKIRGLRTDGAMGTNPALTVGGIMAAGGFIIAVLTQFFGWQDHPEWHAYFDEHGAAIAGAALAAWSLLEAGIIRSKVFSPATTDELMSEAASSGIVVPSP